MSDTSHPDTKGTKPRACDQCRRRKTRCIPLHDTICHKCSAYRLQCTFRDPIGKRGLKANRGKIISELRSQQSSLQSPTASQTSSSADEDFEGNLDVSQQNDDGSQLLPAMGLQYPVTALYPAPARLTDAEVSAVTQQQNRDTEDGCLSFALGVYTLVARSAHDRYSSEKSQADAALGRELLQNLSLLQSNKANVDRPSLATVVVSLVMFHCHSALDNPRLAWFYLRQATTFALTMRLHGSDQEDDFSHSENTREHVLYCILFITERNDSLQRQCPVTLPSPSTRHMLSLEYACGTLGAFTNLGRLVRLYEPFDATFVQWWTDQATTSLGSEQLAQMQDEIQAVSPVRLSDYSDACAVDLICTKSWLTILIWQIALRHGQLSTNAKDISLTFVFPIRVANEVLGYLVACPLDIMRAHGPALVRHLNDINGGVVAVLTPTPDIEAVRHRMCTA